MDMRSLPCVVVGPKTATRHNITDKSKLPYPKGGINDLVIALSMIRPLWTFSVTDNSYNINSYGFEVYESGEKLGEVSWGYFRGDYGFIIKNERIAKEKVRTSSLRTADLKKAVAAIKKTFYRRNFTERFAAATAAIDKLVYSESYDKQRKANKAKYDLDVHAREFAYSLHDEFVASLKAKNSYHIWELHETANLEMLTIEAAKKAVEKREAAVVLRTDGQYIVKLRDKVEIMDDTTLPLWLKAKLGMLKLVGDDHFVSEVGCRVDAECFMVLAGGEGEQI
jgi:hypothetical protein